MNTQERSMVARSAWRPVFWIVVGLLAGLGLGAAALVTVVRPWLAARPTVEEHDDHHDDEPATPSDKVLLSEQAQKNLRIEPLQLRPTSYWKTLTVPGIIVDRPGHSDRRINAPVTASISRIHRTAGDIVKPGDVLFTLKILSESLQLTQQELFKATQDYQLALTQKRQFQAAGDDIPKATRIELDNRITKLEVSVRAFRQELINRGLTEEQVAKVSAGMFITEIPLAVPEPITETHGNPHAHLFEVQELQVELGQQAQAGQTLCLLGHHQLLAVEGRAFREEAPLLEKAVQQGWPVEVDFGESTRDWPTIPNTYPITHLANTIDPESRTFRFLLPLDNQSRILEGEGRTRIIWRFRPGQRIRIQVRIEELKNVFIVPAEAVAHEGAESYIFRQNDDTFERKPVRLLYQDRQSAVLANDGSVLPGIFIAQRGAVQLNRMIKSQSGTVPKGFHIHADGSVHTNH